MKKPSNLRRRLTLRAHLSKIRFAFECANNKHYEHTYVRNDNNVKVVLDTLI